jgi:signal transduction histidine kinase
MEASQAREERVLYEDRDADAIHRQARAAGENTLALGPFRRVSAQRVPLEDDKPVRLSGRAFDMLAALVEHAGRVVGREALIDRAWPQAFLEETSLIQGDRVQLQQVLLNLILNAVEAMGSVETGPRELLISAEQDQTGVLVAVRDSGPGIAPTHTERVFEAFYATKSGGTGMGRSICWSIIDAHGGRLWGEVNEPRCAVFRFTLPGADLTQTWRLSSDRVGFLQDEEPPARDAGKPGQPKSHRKAHGV